MKRSFYFLLLSAVLAGLGMYFVLMAPPRIGYHDDAMRSNRTTEMRNFSLIVYYVFYDEQKSTDRIGTEPYQNFYVRTYALELWVLMAIFAIADGVARRRHADVKNPASG